MRYFIPTKPDKTLVKYWSYTKGHGLKVIYHTGPGMNSSWNLKELLQADHTSGDGLPCKEIQKKP
jgi:hypothetical protein